LCYLRQDIPAVLHAFRERGESSIRSTTVDETTWPTAKRVLVRVLAMRSQLANEGGGTERCCSNQEDAMGRRCVILISSECPTGPGPQAKLAAELDPPVTREYIARLETGRHDPPLSTLERLAKALKVKVGRLLE